MAAALWGHPGVARGCPLEGIACGCRLLRVARGYRLGRGSLQMTAHGRVVACVRSEWETHPPCMLPPRVNFIPGSRAQLRSAVTNCAKQTQATTEPAQSGTHAAHSRLLPTTAICGRRRRLGRMQMTAQGRVVARGCSASIRTATSHARAAGGISIQETQDGHGTQLTPVPQANTGAHVGTLSAATAADSNRCR